MEVRPKQNNIVILSFLTFSSSSNSAAEIDAGVAGDH